MRAPLCRSSSPLLVVLLLLTVAAQAKTITMTATFKYKGPDNEYRPCRYCWCQLIDYDPVDDDVIREGWTDGGGVVTFTYSSGESDGFMGGRIDPFMRCYTKVGIPYGSGRTTVGWVTGKRRIAVTQQQLAYLEVNSRRWDDNNTDRTVTVNATGDAAKGFHIADCLVYANTPRHPGTGASYRALQALGDRLCLPDCWAVFPSAMDCSYSVLTDELWVDSAHAMDQDAILHEVGHREMAQYYGGAFGDYDCTQSKHNFNSPLSNSLFTIGDADWTAFSEAWADFSAAISKQQPVYHGNDVEDPRLTEASARCEGTICRILWDIADTHAYPVMSGDSAVARAPIAGVPLDDDPFGYVDNAFYNAMPGLSELKNLIRTDHPKSWSDLRGKWRNKYGVNTAKGRAFDAVSKANGITAGIFNTAPSCTLTVTGPSLQETINGQQATRYTGDLSLSAVANDSDQGDQDLRHVTFYWSYLSPNSGQLYERSSWTAIGVDATPGDGFKCSWPRGSQPTSPNLPACIVAVSSDFFEESSYSLNPAGFTPGQKGPVYFGGGPVVASSFSATKSQQSHGWYWLSTTGAAATWEFSPSGLASWPDNSVKLRFDGLMTNRASGGAGYSSPLTFKVSFALPSGGGATMGTMQTVNPYGAPNPNVTNGTGYVVNGVMNLNPSVVKYLKQSTKITAQLVWPACVQNSYHVAARKESLSFVRQ